MRGTLDATQEPTWVLPGPHTAAVGAGLWLLVVGLDSVHAGGDEAAAARSVRQLWALVSAAQAADGVGGAAPTVADVLDVLSGGMVRGLPEFALVLAEGGSMRVLVRGAVVARVGDVEVTAGDVLTWVETVVPAARSVLLASLGTAVGDVAAAGIIGAGVVTAGGLRCGYATVAPAEAGEIARLPEPDVATSEDDVVPDLEADPEDADDHHDVVADVGPAEAPAEAEGGPGDQPAEAESQAPVETEPSSSDDEFDALFGHTVMRTVEGAAVRDDATTTEPMSTSPAAPQQDRPAAASPSPVETPAGPTRVAAEPVVHQPPPARRPLIDGIPGSAPAPAPPPVASAQPDVFPPSAAAPDAPVNEIDAADEQTVRRAPVPASVNGTDSDVPTVLAIRCRQGHPNPPQSDTCRLCGLALGTGSVVTIARPPLGRLVFDSGQTIPITRPIVMGRAPKSPTAPRGEVPVLFTVPSPSGDVSRSHLEVVLEGWHVQVVDLGSANGTTVTQPGLAPRRLHPGEPVTLQSGARVSLSDEVGFRYEVCA